MRAIALLLLTFAAALAADERQLRDAAAKGIAALERGTKNWYRTQTCVSCHHQSLPLMAVREAREHGVPVYEAHWREMSAKAFAFTQDLDQAVQYWNIIDPALTP